ncbi:MAG: response regulator, partial [Calditerrivibrio sp.]|nr:response regulator [Calditerrivibrio sp.]
MKNILIVEDSAFFQKVIENELKELEYNIFNAYSIKEAIDIIRSNKIDMITLDIELPDGLGYELCKMLKKDPMYAGIQVIVVTNTSDEDASIKSFEAGALGYIHKDNLKRDLKRYIKNILSIINNLSFSNNKILLIEDSDFQRKYFKHLLEFAKLDVLDFKDTESAKAYLEKEKPVIDLAVLDYFLSDNTTCTEMILYLKENKFYEQVPTIVLTVSKDLSHKYEIFVIGGNDFLIKPFDTSEFYLRVRNQLKTKHLMDMLDAKNKLLTISATTDELTKLYNRRFFWD